METLSIQGVTQPKIVFNALLEECEEILPLFQDLVSRMENPDFNLEDDHLAHSKLSQSLHRLRGSAGFIGLVNTAALAKSCETALKENNLALYEQLKGLSNEIEVIIKKIKE